MNEENEIEREREREREGRKNDGNRVNLEVEMTSKEELGEGMKRMKNGKAVGPEIKK